jgi:tetratricopeptide (TPR) repeat protein
LKPKWSEAYFNLGVAFTENQDYENAIEMYQKAIELDDKLHYAWYNLACILALKDDIRGSLRCLKSAIDRQGQEIDYREMAQFDKYFAKLWDRPEFNHLIH